MPVTSSLINGLLNPPVWSLVPGVIVIIISYVFSFYAYNLLLHPLRRFPGPISGRSSSIFSLYHMLAGDIHLWIHSLHQRYGPVVRVSPNALSFIDARAWKDIYGFRKAPAEPFIKDPMTYGNPPGGAPSLLTAGDEAHSRMRRIFAHAFSERALREQEDIITKYVGILIQKLRDEACGMAEEQGSVIESEPKPVDMVRWLNFTTFDIMGDLTFGEPLGLLDKSEYTPWVSMIFASVKAASYVRAINGLPGMRILARWLVPRSLIEKREAHLQFSADRVSKRLEAKTARPDIWTLVLRNAGEEGKSLSFKEMHSNAALFMGAGTETTATELSGMLYLLARNPEKMKKLVQEIRGSLRNEDDITMEKLIQLKYLNACLEEGLRVYMPVPIGLPRIVPKGGAEVAGVWVPGGVRVSVPQYATYHSSRNFHDPESFIPERWLGDPAYASDQKDAVQPFSYGPRNCIGKNLAYHEMRLVLTRLLWNFDLELAPESAEWPKQKVYALWQKAPLMMKLKPAKR